MSARPEVLLFACPKCGARAGAPCVRIGPTYVPGRGPGPRNNGRGHCVMRDIGRPIGIAHRERVAAERDTRPITWRDPLPVSFEGLRALRAWLREYGDIFVAPVKDLVKPLSVRESRCVHRYPGTPEQPMSACATCKDSPELARHVREWSEWLAANPDSDEARWLAEWPGDRP